MYPETAEGQRESNSSAKPVKWQKNYLIDKKS
jgi:hypothetical protein